MTDVMRKMLIVLRALEIVDRKFPSAEEMEPVIAENTEFEEIWHTFSAWLLSAEVGGLDETAARALHELVKATYCLGGKRKANENLDVFEEHIGGGDE